MDTSTTGGTPGNLTQLKNVDISNIGQFKTLFSQYPWLVDYASGVINGLIIKGYTGAELYTQTVNIVFGSLNAFHSVLGQRAAA